MRKTSSAGQPTRSQVLRAASLGVRRTLRNRLRVAGPRRKTKLNCLNGYKRSYVHMKRLVPEVMGRQGDREVNPLRGAGLALLQWLRLPLLMDMTSHQRRTHGVARRVPEMIR